MGGGWIKIQKSILKHWVWDDAFVLRAWMFILLSVNYEDKKILFDKKLITVKRGQLVTSIRKLALIWECSKERVSRTLKLFENDGMLTVDSNNKRTLLTVVNYGLYQDCRDTDEDTDEDTDKDTHKDTDSPQHKKIKNIKELKEEKKNIYVDSVTQIFAYLNEKTGKNYTGRSKAQKDHIVARLKEGYTVEEFKKVIDNKVLAWGNSDKMKQYLRPETLFGTKFETYLNETEDKGRREDDEIHRKQRAAIAEATSGFGFS